MLLGTCARNITNQLNLFHFEDVHKCHSCHISVISCLVVMKKLCLSLIVCAVILQVEPTEQVVLKFVVARTLLVNITQARPEERL